MPDKKKKSKSEVNYRESMSSEHCGNCAMFRRLVDKRGECTIVAGPIHAFDLCDEWAPDEEDRHPV